MRYLIDTNVLSHVISDPRGRVAKRISQVGQSLVCTSIIVAAELRFGVIKRRSTVWSARLEELLNTVDVMPFEAPADAIYGEERLKLQAAGTPIGANDMLIAAHALALECTLVTDNVREFARVEGLPLENWLRDD